MSHSTIRGLVYALLAAAISGIAIFYNKLVIVKGIDPQIFNILKNGGVAIILTTYLLGSRKSTSIAKLSFSSWKKLAAIALVGGSIPFILYFDGLKTVPALNANLIQKTMFLWVALLAIPILKESINRWQVIGFLLILASNFFIGGFQGFSANSGELLIFSATIFWSVENILARNTLVTIDATIGAWSRMFFGTLIIIGFVIFQGKIGLLSRLSPSYILPIFGSIILLTGYVTSWYKALKLAPATAVTSILILATPITNILTMIFITRSLNWEQTVQAGISIIGVGIIAFFTSSMAKAESRNFAHT